MLNMSTPLFLAADVEVLCTEFALNIVVFTPAAAGISFIQWQSVVMSLVCRVVHMTGRVAE